MSKSLSTDTNGLPLLSQLRFRWVCKLWLNLISEFQILGSCNGLILVMPSDILCIWNPSTKEFKKLPDTPVEFPSDLDHCREMIVYGFGYNKITDDYKVVVRIVTFEDERSEVKVYSLGSDSWRRIQDIPDYLRISSRQLGKFVNGALHWTTCTKRSSNEEKPVYTILSLNMEDEKYGEIQQPNNIDATSRRDTEELGGCLCIPYQFDVSEADQHTEIFVLKDYGVKESWTSIKVYFSSYGEYEKPLKFTKNGEILLMKDFMALILYDPKSGTEKKLNFHAIQHWFIAHTYVESLVSLNSHTFVGKEQGMENNLL